MTPPAATPAMTHVQDLERRFDGAIPEPLRTAAAALDVAEGRRSPVRVRVRAWKPAGIVARMADIMVRRHRAGQTTEIMDLVRAGFTRTEITMHGTSAVGRASLILRGEGA